MTEGMQDYQDAIEDEHAALPSALGAGCCPQCGRGDCDGRRECWEYTDEEWADLQAWYQQMVDRIALNRASNKALAAILGTTVEAMDADCGKRDPVEED